MLKYEIITKKQTYKNSFEEVLEEQKTTCKALGFSMEWNAEDVIIHYFHSAFRKENIFYMNVWEALDGLAVKDGFDLVQFENGNYGFVAYYSGHVNGFEIFK